MSGMDFTLFPPQLRAPAQSSYFEVDLMKKPDRLDYERRAREKQLARDADERDLKSGRRSAEEIRQSNSMFASIGDAAFDNARIIFPEKE